MSLAQLWQGANIFGGNKTTHPCAASRVSLLYCFEYAGMSVLPRCETARVTGELSPPAVKEWEKARLC